jgi:hypothetical protein
MLLLLASCAPERVLCTGVPTPGVVLTVVDGSDGRDISRIARVTIRLLSSDFRETTGTPTEATQLTVVAGTYSMVVRASGYADVADTLVVRTAKQGYCDEAIVQIKREVRLSRAP